MSASRSLAAFSRSARVNEGRCPEPGRLPTIRAVRAETVRKRSEFIFRCPLLARACVALLLLAGTVSAQRDLKNVPVPDVRAELDAFELADGFEVNLFAADPLVVKPIQMNWDERGRLWICGSSIYPHIRPGQKADDKIVILEDTDGDGRADKHTVFADDLHIPTGILPGDGGVYVANSTEILHLRDTDGDDRADERRVLLSGFGVEDAHHLIHTFRWGMDGHLYFNQSIYTHSHVETPWGVRLLASASGVAGAGGLRTWRREPMGTPIRPLGPVLHDRRSVRRRDQLPLPGRRIHCRRRCSAPDERAQPRPAQALRAGGRLGKAHAGGMAGPSAHGRLPGQPHQSVRPEQRRQRVHVSAGERPDLQRPCFVPAGRRPDGA